MFRYIICLIFCLSNKKRNYKKVHFLRIANVGGTCMSIFDSPLLKPFHDMGAKAGAKAADKIIQSINNKKTDTKSCLESSGSYDEGLKKIMVKAEQGDLEAMVMVGDCFNRGLHTEKNDREAHRYYKMAADKGHIQANLMVAIDLLNGIGTVTGCSRWWCSICPVFISFFVQDWGSWFFWKRTDGHEIF